MIEEIDDYILNAKNWQNEMQLLRQLLIDCGLTETYKWRAPCYTFNDKNVAMIGNFKDFCTISFFKGVLLKDPLKLLVSPGENSRSAKLLKFTNSKEIIEHKDSIKLYIHEAVELEKSGQKVELKHKKELTYPEELLNVFSDVEGLKQAFTALTPGRQRGYLIYFNSAKQSATRTSRIKKYVPRILNGKGFHDCVCGQSKKMPTCDGSHKYIK